MVRPWNWTCPFCGSHQTVTTNVSIEENYLGASASKHGWVGVQTFAVACANDGCRELTLVCTLHKVVVTGVQPKLDISTIFEIGRHPASSHTPQPDYILKPLRDDYYEACAIERLSPKASATLSRRCIQGMIRDFCGISKVRLIDEIKELRAQVDAGTAKAGILPDIIDAIDAVREVGNIGAHMERDINVIVDIDPGEARVLIELIELLFREWYVARHDRQERIANLGALQAAKAAQRALPPPTTPQL